MADSRHVTLPGCTNFRDLGGLPTRGGGRVAWRRLYRGAALPYARPEVASEVVARLAIRRVIDLRTDAELVLEGAPALPAPCERVHLPLFPRIRASWVYPADKSPRASAGRYMEMVEDAAPALVRIVEALRDLATTPTVIHCAAGRDRTGILTACLLDLAGVPEDTIAEDYALSDAAISDGERAYAGTMTLFLRMIRERHGSTRAMLLRNGAPESSLDAIVRALLEDPRTGAGG